MNIIKIIIAGQARIKIGISNERNEAPASSIPTARSPAPTATDQMHPFHRQAPFFLVPSLICLLDQLRNAGVMPVGPKDPPIRCPSALLKRRSGGETSLQE
jgi:hypothetical protein